MGVEKVDEKFVTNAAKDGHAEVELAQLAQQQAGSSQVRAYAQRLAQDHQQADQQLKAIASQKGIQLPDEPNNKQKRDRDKLAKRQGAEFDKEYIDAVVKDHKKAIKEFDKEAKDGKDPDIKAFASQTAEKLREHLNQAQKLQTDLKNAPKTS